MADTKQPKEISEKYKIADKIKQTGYLAKIDGQTIDVRKAKYDTRESLSGGVERYIEKECVAYVNEVECEEGFITNLSEEQLWQLAHAGVIELSLEQQNSFSQKFYFKK